jgi:tetratricopeptide (TPR) repeat protein
VINGMENEGVGDPPGRDDAELDAILAAADSSMLAAIREHLDLEAGIKQIISGQFPSGTPCSPPGDLAAHPVGMLLGLLACLADTEVPLILFEPPVVAGSALSAVLDTEVLPDLLDTLAEFGLAEMGGSALPMSGSDASAGQWPVLKLRTAARDKTRRKPAFGTQHSAYLTLAASLLRRAAERGDPEHPKNWPWWRLLAPHCGFMLHSIAEGLVLDLPADTVDEVASAAAEAARYLYARGFLDEAEAEFEAILKVRQQLTSENNTAAILAARDWRACVLRDRGHLAAAERELQAVYEARRDLLIRTPDPTGTMARLASIDWRTPEGLRLLERGWDSRSARPLLDMVDSYGAIATTLAYRARSPEDNPSRYEAAARRAHLAAYEARRRVLGDHHRDTVATRCNVAVRVYNEGLLTGRNDLLEEAEQEFRSVYETERQLPGLGGHHPDTLVTLTWLATALQALGRMDESEAASREAYRLCKQILGDYHFHTLWAHRCLTDVLYDRGEQAAEAEEQAVIAAWRHLVNAESPVPEEGLPNLSNREGLAWALIARGRRLLSSSRQPAQGNDTGSTVVPSSEAKQASASIDYPSIETALGCTTGSPRSRALTAASRVPGLGYTQLAVSQHAP